MKNYVIMLIVLAVLFGLFYVLFFSSISGKELIEAEQQTEEAKKSIEEEIEEIEASVKTNKKRVAELAAEAVKKADAIEDKEVVQELNNVIKEAKQRNTKRRNKK